MAFDKLHVLIERMADFPGIRQVRMRRYERRFRCRLGHAFHGVFDSYSSAAAHVPLAMPSSYDTPAAAAMYVERLQVDDHDYPALCWLLDAVHAGMHTIADLGGSTGIKFHAFSPLLGHPAELRWRVIEVPSAVRLGREIAESKGLADVLQFTSDVEEASGCDVLFASGALQYLPESLGEILARLPHKPRRVIVNTTPVHASRSFFTLNNIGAACCPYRVTARDEILAQVVGNGYRLRDHWRNLGKRLDLPFAKGLALDHYSGFCFDRA